MKWVMVTGRDPIVLGLIPMFLSEDDPRPAAQQLDANYRHGGGWRPMPGFSLNERGQLCYHKDGEEDEPPMNCLAATQLRHEDIRFFEHQWLVIIQPDGSFEVSRCD